MLVHPTAVLGWTQRHLPSLLAAFWALGIAQLALKALSPAFDALTSYGVHKPDAAAGIIDRRSGFLAFYLIGATLSLGCLVFHILHIPPTNAFFISHPAFLLVSYGVKLLEGQGGLRIDALKPHVGMAPQPFPTALLLLLIHSMVRLYETLAVHRFSACERLTAYNFLAGIAFYVATVLTVAHVDVQPIDSPEPPAPWALISAIVVFAVASLRQAECHRSLARIRPRGMDLTSATRHYRVPQGMAFRDMACPHYFFEILIYAAIWFLKIELNTTLLLLFVASNLLQRAACTRRWYRDTFGASYSPGAAALPRGPTHALGLLLQSSGNSRSEVMPM